MHFNRKKLLPHIATALLFGAGLFGTIDAFARAGGGGGGHSGGGGGFSGGGGGYYGHGHGHTSPGELLGLLVIIAIVLIYNYYNKKNQEEKQVEIPHTALPFPEGLNADKIQNAFFAIQNAWQNKDLTHVRKWLSDGMYQRFTTQFRMMEALGQTNTLSNIQIKNIVVCAISNDGNYQTAEVAIVFKMDDRFISVTHPEFNETYTGDLATEYWTFIKRTNSKLNTDLYSNNNCPNCGAPLDIALGEISRCSSCNTLTNSASYDWILSEITQADDYNGGAGMNSDSQLQQLMQGDSQFSVQRMEDIASNIFMQIMDVLTGDKDHILSRFAEDNIAQMLLSQKHAMPPFLFDRLYLNSVTLTGYKVENDLVKLYFDLKATFRRVSTNGRLQLIDNDFVTALYRMELSRHLKLSQRATDTVFSYECSSCGAPYTDTTENECTYCGAPVIDLDRNWVLTNFALS